jgi:hypothetical protein
MGKFFTAHQQNPQQMHPNADIPNPGNTIVYIKPTSRGNSLTPWQVVHNIGHALWLRNPKLKVMAEDAIKKFIYELQQSHYTDDKRPPSKAEVTIILSRLMNNLMMQRALNPKMGAIERNTTRALSGWNAPDEVLFDMFPVFVTTGGRIKFYPRENLTKLVPFNRAEKLTPNPEIMAHIPKGVDNYGPQEVRDWVWEPMASNKDKWEELSYTMTNIIVLALKNLTWAARKNAPINDTGGIIPAYPYQKLTTEP